MWTGADGRLSCIGGRLKRLRGGQRGGPRGCGRRSRPDWYSAVPPYGCAGGGVGRRAPRLSPPNVTRRGEDERLADGRSTVLTVDDARREAKR